MEVQVKEVIPVSLPLESSGAQLWRSGTFKIKLPWFISPPQSLLAAPACFEEQSRARADKFNLLLLPGASAALTCWQGWLWCSSQALDLLSSLCQVTTRGCWSKLSERRILGRLMSIFSSITSLRSSLLSVCFAVC